MIPLCHDFAGSRVLVFGGGSIGARRARTFAREAEVVVVSPTFADADFDDAQRVRAAPEASDLEFWLDRVDPALAVAATDDTDLNAAVAAAARDRGILVNRVDDSGEEHPNSVAVPATVREDPVVAAVSTGATSPAVSKHLRRELEPILDGAGDVATLTADLRERLHERDLPPETRHEALRRVVDDDRLWNAVSTPDGDPDAVISEVLSEFLDEPP